METSPPNYAILEIAVLLLTTSYIRGTERTVKNKNERSFQTRRAVRALILSDNDEVLLLRMEHPERKGNFWLLPGGGVKFGEDPVVALRREVWEETRMNLSPSPTLIWRRTHRFKRGFADATTAVDQHEQIFFVRSRRFEPTADNNPDPSKVGLFHEFRWWTVAALNEAKGELFAPRSLPLLVQQLVVDGYPSTPVTLDD
ncbi:MAG: NUDIX domain-containing protein [Gammaproteobacteria bacterium]|nr:NUDIX domain-containing protein [Gammaproteobacteria bacterium]